MLHPALLHGQFPSPDYKKEEMTLTTLKWAHYKVYRCPDKAHRCSLGMSCEIRSSVTCVGRVTFRVTGSECGGSVQEERVTWQGQPATGDCDRGTPSDTAPLETEMSQSSTPLPPYLLVIDISLWNFFCLSPRVWDFLLNFSLKTEHFWAISISHFQNMVSLLLKGHLLR